jgi:hypothetical protein
LRIVANLRDIVSFAKSVNGFTGEDHSRCPGQYQLDRFSLRQS